MPSKAPAFSVILAAGKGTRMRAESHPKVCFPVDGVPSINRAIGIYNDCGLSHHVVVVGALAGQVVETVGDAFDNVSFAYQAEQLGTAHAAQVGLRALAPLRRDADVLLVAGDRIVSAPVLEQLFNLYYSGKCDLVFVSAPRNEGSGRIVETDDGEILGVVEVPDIRQREVYRQLHQRLEAGGPPSAEEVEQALREGFSAGRETPAAGKFATAFGALWEQVAGRSGTLDAEALLACIPEDLTRFEFTGHGGTPLRKSPAEVDASPFVNISVYLGKVSAVRWALQQLDRRNAQQEEYLSDMVGILAASERPGGGRRRVRALRVMSRGAVLGFNNPAELIEVEEHFRSRKQARAAGALPASSWFRPITAWCKALEALLHDPSAADTELLHELTTLYGDADDFRKERTRALLATLEHAAELLSADAAVLIVRSPGRLNGMGRHVDHQGGNCNLMTIGYETIMVVHPRDDDMVCLHNVDADRFGPREFSIRQMMEDLPWEDWLSLVNSEEVSRMVSENGGDWSHYVKAAVLRLQMKFSNTSLRGMDLVVSGNIPMAAGLSSSSSLVVATAEATTAVNQLDTFPAQIVDLCGEGEWFVGTRGGSADHAAVKFGQKGSVIKVSFFEFAVQETVPFPPEYIMAVCDSGIQAKKSAHAKDQFNHRVACYRVGFLLIRKEFPQYAPLLHHLRDVNTRNLGVPLSWIYRVLLHLPEQATRDALRAMLHGEDLDTLFASHEPPEDGLYPVRGVILYGLAECERARRFADLLKERRVEELGRMMDVSHDGDRVSSHDAAGQASPYRAPTSNGYLLSLMDDLDSGDPQRVTAAQLEWQPGSYFCSLPEIDRMVDIARKTEGVMGAQLAGAGLGGCMMVLAHRDAAARVIERLSEAYYKPAGMPPRVLLCRPIAGSGVLGAQE